MPDKSIDKDNIPSGIPIGYVEDRQNFDTVIIEDGCLVCNSCESIYPKGFKVFETHTEVLGLIRQDGLSTNNINELSPLNGLGLADRAFLQEVADNCCVEVIKLIRKTV